MYQENYYNGKFSTFNSFEIWLNTIGIVLAVALTKINLEQLHKFADMSHTMPNPVGNPVHYTYQSIIFMLSDSHCLISIMVMSS